MAGRAGRAASSALARSTERPAGLALGLLVGLWVVVIYDPPWLLAAHGLTPALKSRLLLNLGVMASLAIGVASVPAWARRWEWNAPLLALILFMSTHMMFAINPGVVWWWVQEWGLMWMLMAATFVFIDSVRRVEQLLILYAFGFLWFGLWGVPYGSVQWHIPTLLNPDGFGSFMVIGIGFTAFMGMAVGKGWLRKALWFTSAVCVVGVVASFARGAFLAAIMIYFVIWLRSPKKGKTFAAGVVGALVLVAAAALLHGDAFWAEMQSAFNEGAEEGTGEDRWLMWQAAIKVWEHTPIIGAGPNNWGIYAAEHLTAHDVGGRYGESMGRMYLRSLHNLYFTLLSEGGIIGVSLFIAILVDFWKKNAALKTKAAAARWAELGGRFQLKSIAFGLELALVGFLTIAMLYSTSGKHWFFTITGLNLLLWKHVVKGMKRPKPLRTGGATAPVAGLMPPAPASAAHVAPASAHLAPAHDAGVPGVSGNR